MAMPLPRDAIEQWLATLERLQGRAGRHRHQFRELEAFCLFAGYPKSGHSLIGALLDAHPDMVVAHELDALRCVRAGLSREMIFSLLLETAAAFHAAGHAWNGYDYSVPGQWQGRFRQLKVIGDKKGGGTSQHLLQHPELLDQAVETLGLPLRWVHVTRHPAANIAAIARQFGTPLPQAADFYFALAESVARLKLRIEPASLFEIRYETFAAEPRRHLATLCEFLGQTAPPDYLDACAAVVRPAAERRGPPPDWPAGLYGQVAERAACYPFLAVYAFESD
jgi:hypothetical protein